MKLLIAAEFDFEIEDVFQLLKLAASIGFFLQLFISADFVFGIIT